MASEVLCNGKAPSLPSLNVVKKVEKSFPHVTNMNWLLHIHYVRKDFEICKELIDYQLKEYMNPEYLFFTKGLIEKEEGNHFDALRNFKKAVDINPNNIETYKEIGKSLYTMGKFKQSLGVFREAESMANRPDHEIFHYIGELLFRNASQKRTLIEESKGYFQKAVLYGRKLESYQRLAEIFRQEKDYIKAIEILENCLQIYPENTDVLTEIGVLCLKVNETQRAFEKLMEVTIINEKCPRGLLAFGAILQSRNDVDGALLKYKQIDGMELDSPELWNNIGLCFFKKNKLIVAISCLKKSIWLSPLNYNSLYNLSLVFITAQQYASAFHTLAAAINLRKDSAECYMLLGICLRKLEDQENAYIALERAAMLPDATKNPLIYLNLALFCYEVGAIEKAVINFNIFMKMARDTVLTTEYKFYATKLKALLQDKTDEFESRDENDIDSAEERTKSSQDVAGGESHVDTQKEEFQGDLV